MLRKIAVASVIAAALTTSASGAVLYTIGDGNNECGSGGFKDCKLNNSPTIAKFGFSGTNWSLSDLGGFASVNGGEFSFTITDTKMEDGKTETIGVDWTYSLGTGDPGLTAVVVKAGNNWAWTSVFNFANGVYSGSLSTLAAGLTSKKGIAQGFSHVTFFDTAAPPPPPPPPVIPLPAAGWLMLAGFGGLAALRRRRKAA